SYLVEGANDLVGGRLEDASGRCRIGGTAFLQDEKQRHGEHRKPPGYQQVGCPNVLAGFRRESERGDVGGDQHEVPGQQAEEPAYVAEGPSITGDPSYLAGRRDFGKEGVVEYVAQLECNIRHDEPDERVRDL